MVFERHLDSVLERLVDDAPPCEVYAYFMGGHTHGSHVTALSLSSLPPLAQAKTEWRRRQRDYKNELAKKQRNATVGGGGGGGGPEGGMDDNFLNWLIDLAVPIVAVIVVFLIGLARSRR